MLRYTGNRTAVVLGWCGVLIHSVADQEAARIGFVDGPAPNATLWRVEHLVCETLPFSRFIEEFLVLDAGLPIIS